MVSLTDIEKQLDFKRYKLGPEFMNILRFGA